MGGVGVELVQLRVAPQHLRGRPELTSVILMAMLCDHSGVSPELMETKISQFDNKPFGEKNYYEI